jgi:hypothetical protein
MGKSGKGFSGIYSRRASGVTRRQFLVAAASTPVAAVIPDFSHAADADDHDLDADLVLILSEDEKTLIVRRAAKDPESRPKYTDWTLAAAAFGPYAWFDMDVREYAAGPSRRYFAVRNVSYGAHQSGAGKQPLSYIFVFEQVKSDKPAASEGGKAGTVWKVGLETNIWSQSAMPKPFGKSGAQLYRWLGEGNEVKIEGLVSAVALNSALASMFDGQIVAAGNTNISFYPDLSWRIQNLDSGKALPLNAFGGRLPQAPPG